MMPDDPRGHALLADRLARAPGFLLDYVARPPAPPSPAFRATRHFVVTGTGSSEAHARFLQHLINRQTPAAAEFLPLSAFLRHEPAAAVGKTLVLFSQGLSPNAQTALQRRGEFAHVVVVTATTAEGAEAAGKVERAELLRELATAGVEFIRFPVEEEYTTLMRLIGPLCAYAAAWHLAAGLPGSRLPPLRSVDLAPLLSVPRPEALREAFVGHADAFRRGFYLVAAAPLAEFGQNLAAKFLEGLFWSAPVLWDYLQFAHGPFQEVTLNARPVVLLHGPEPIDADLAGRAASMLQRAGLPAITVRHRQSGPLAIFELETAFNLLVVDLIRHFDVDQINWPSKGHDDPLYGFARIG